MNKSFYYSLEYKKKQSEITKNNWKNGVFNFLYKKILRKCVRPGCDNKFIVKPSDPKIHCSSSCAAIINNKGRIVSDLTKEKIRLKLLGRRYPDRPKASPKYTVCNNPGCNKTFLIKYWRSSNNPAKYCSNKCAMKVIGGKPTSPRAARGKAGIREDIDAQIYFYSRWEANIARVFNFLRIKWFFQSKTFNIGGQNYTPDFYLPEYNLWIEVKNFLSEYSRMRDERFRKLYPNYDLILILKKGYLEIQKRFAQYIKGWEFGKN